MAGIAYACQPRGYFLARLLIVDNPEWRERTNII
jgi:hypothetical protein